MDVSSKLMKTCDPCKARKVRCGGIGHPGATKCLNCARRNEVCSFSPVRIRKRRYASSSRQESVIGSAKKVNSELRDESENFHDDLSSFAGMSKYDGLQELYVDRLLAAPEQGNALSAQSPSLQDLGVFGSEYSLTFFPEARLKELAVRLGHDRVSHARAKVANIIGERMKTIERVPAPAPDSDRIRVFDIEEGYIATCVQAYFDHIDPIHPFLDRQPFEDVALSPHLRDRLASDKSWSALFYAVLALGSQYHDGGSYEPSKSGSWRFFGTALAIFPDLLISRTTLTTVQALTAMAVFASNLSCLQIEYAMVSEGAKKAQTLGYNRSTAPGNDERNRTFYVLYFLEKNMSFNIGRCSTIMDSDISSTIPALPLSCSGTSFDWTRASIRISRLLSRIYASLFSVSVRGRPKAYYNMTIHNLKSELGAWAKTIPAELRPGQPIRPYTQTTQMIDIGIRLHYLYHGTMLHLDRTALQLEDESTARSDLVNGIMRTARTVLELTKFIDMQPYTPIWILASVPLAAYLVLFDLVIDNPAHPETAANLAILDVGSGHFSGLEYASQGILPGSIASEFAQIARTYVREQNGWETNSRPKSSAMDAEGVTAVEGLQEATVAEASSAFPSYADLQPFPLGWNLRNDGGTMLDGESLDLFGSYYPLWDEGAAYNMMNL